MPAPPDHPRPTLPTSYKWKSSEALIFPKNDSRKLAGVKDPSIVYHEGTYHIFATTALGGNWSMFYMNFTDWSEANNAPFVYLDQTAIGAGYTAAPQIFYFKPQKLWYLVYQNNNAAYSTNPDIGNPAGWTAAKTFYPKMPKIVEENIKDGYWLDFWVICDHVNCHLFSSDDMGQLYRSQTPMSKFPEGMSEPVIAMQEPERFRLFEAANVYRVDKTDSYLLLVECIGSDGRRWFRSWGSSAIEGPWTALADEEDTPFLRSNNVEFDGEPWTIDISHGEMIRKGYDQFLKIDLHNMQFVYQGMDPEDAEGLEYGDLPWRLALLTRIG